MKSNLDILRDAVAAHQNNNGGQLPPAVQLPRKMFVDLYGDRQDLPVWFRGVPVWPHDGPEISLTKPSL